MSVSVVGAKLGNELDYNWRNTKSILLFKKNSNGMFYPRTYHMIEYLWFEKRCLTLTKLIPLAGIPAEGKSSVCLICMKYRITILIIIIISLDKILSSYIANTSRTHRLTHVHTRVHAHPDTRPSLFAVSVRPTMTPSWLGAPFPTLARQWPIGDSLK